MKKNILVLFIIMCLLVIIALMFVLLNKIEEINNKIENNINTIIQDDTNLGNLKEEDIDKKTNSNSENNVNKNIEIDDWRLTLVNYENTLSEDFKIELASIDDIRKFDKRAISKLNQMLLDMKNDNIKGVWVQSSYRSVEEQEKVFNEQVSKYIQMGKTKKEAEEMTLKIINKPGTSEHNLGLAVDFNYVNLDFEDTKGFKWLKENAEKYGFVLRYKKEKEDVTKVDYEPWHWRYVGEEHAKKMNELDLCLEEYIEYLKGEGS